MAIKKLDIEQVEILLPEGLQMKWVRELEAKCAEIDKTVADANERTICKLRVRPTTHPELYLARGEVLGCRKRGNKISAEYMPLLVTYQSVLEMVFNDASGFYKKGGLDLSKLGEIRMKLTSAEVELRELLAERVAQAVTDAGCCNLAEEMYSLALEVADTLYNLHTIRMAMQTAGDAGKRERYGAKELYHRAITCLRREVSVAADVV